MLIGVSARIHYPGHDPLKAGRAGTGVWSKTVHYLEQSVAHWVMAGGGLAVMVPAAGVGADLGADPGAAGDRVDGQSVDLADYAAALDGLVLQGGNDVDPQHYGEDPMHEDWAGDRERDRYEMALIRAFVAAGKPVFGICRGLQLINVSFGGTLLQDISTLRPEALHHRVPGRYEHHHHAVDFVPGTRLAALFPGLTGGRTNSIHHQGIKDLAPGFRVEALCPDDGMIEAIRRDGPGYVAGVQWHPEFHRPGDPATLDDRAILQDFLAACRSARAG
jgi:putative glutamine amidotransferase